MGNVFIAEFKPKDPNRIPLFWKLALSVIGTGYYHSGMVIDNRYFEMFDGGYRELPFKSFEDLNQYRGAFNVSYNNHGDCIDFFDVPSYFNPDELNLMINWWENNIRRAGKFGYVRFIQLAFWKYFRFISEYYHKKTGRVLLFARTDAQKSVRVCSSAYDECLKSIGYDLYADFDETITVPGLAAQRLVKVYPKT